MWYLSLLPCNIWDQSMMINYKRLNDNKCDDAYKIPNIDSLINGK